MQRRLAGVAGELSGGVQDAVAQPLRFAELVLAVEREQLRPHHHVVPGERELKPRRVRLEGVERQVAGAGRLRVLIRSSTCACWRCVASSSARSVSAWSVMKHRKRWPRPPPTRASEPPPSPPGSRRARSRRSTAPPAAPSRPTRPRRTTTAAQPTRRDPTRTGNHPRASQSSGRTPAPDHAPNGAPGCHRARRTDRRSDRPIGDQRQQPGPRLRGQILAVCLDMYGPDTRTSHHRQGEPPERGIYDSQPRSSLAQADVSARSPRQSHSANDESRLGSSKLSHGPDRSRGSRQRRRLPVTWSATAVDRSPER